MNPRAALCRAEHARQLALALNDPLPNRRAIAVRAVAAWLEEALRSEEREGDGSPSLSPSDEKKSPVSLPPRQRTKRKIMQFRDIVAYALIALIVLSVSGVIGYFLNDRKKRNKRGY